MRIVLPRLAAVLICIAAAANPASAQLGDPFTEASLTNALRGLQVAQGRMAEANALRQQFYGVQNKRGQLLTDNEKVIEAYRVADNKHGECVQEYLSNLESDPNRQMEIQRKMMAMATDPAAIQKLTTLQMSHAELAAKGTDTTGMRKITEELQKLMGVDPKADSAAARTKCGAGPRQPAAVAEADRLEKQSDTLSMRMRGAEESADADGAKAAGVSLAAFRMMWERLQTYLSKASALPPAEGVILLRRKAEIEAALKLP
jgi:hypothetical protein